VVKKKRKTISPKRSRAASSSSLTSPKALPWTNSDQHPPRGERGVHGGDEHERVAAERARDRALVLGLELVVELLGDPFAQLGEDGAHVEAGGQALDQRHQHDHVAQVGLDRLGDAGVLDLDRHVAAVARGRAVDLADRGGGEGLLVEVREGVAQGPAEL